MSPAYLFVESRDAFCANDTSKDHDLLKRLATGGHSVKLLLVQDGVVASRRGVKSESLERIIDSGVTVLADRFALSERGISPNQLIEGVRLASVEVVVDRLVAGAKVVWL